MNSRFLRILWLIPILAIGYVDWMNLMPLGSNITYSIDVGAEDTEAKAGITGPFDRISGKKDMDGISFRELEKNLVYFEINDGKLDSADEIGVSVRFQNNFPGDAKFMVGARGKQEEWSYSWKELYIPFYEKLIDLPLVTGNETVKVYAMGNDDENGFHSVDEFLQNPPLGSVIASNDKSLSADKIMSQELTGVDVSQFAALDITPAPPAGAVEENGTLIINTALRGEHTLWTYVNNGSLNLEVTKQDLNWYEKPDEMAIEVYSLAGELKGKAIIPDDSDGSNGKIPGPLQPGALKIEGLKTGSYRIEIKGDNDLLIRKIRINQAKLVFDKRIFLIGANPTYFKGDMTLAPVSLYGKNTAASQISFHTWHNSGLQQVNIHGNDIDAEISINMVDTDFSTTLMAGSYQLITPRQNILIKSEGYFSFTPDSFFLPRRCKVIDLKYDLSWLKDNANYILVRYGDYVPPIADDGWLVAHTSWKKEDLIIKDDKLNFCFNVPHLEVQPGKPIPIDWIEITVNVPPIKIGGGSND